MSKKADKLYDFIHAMTSHERGYFKQQSGKDSYYLVLFECICKQKEYNEDSLTHQLQQAGCNRKLSAMKDYLWQELMQKMAMYHLPKTTIGKAISMFQNFYLLKEKGLVSHMESELENIKKFCQAHELYEMQLHVMRLEFNVTLSKVIPIIDEGFWKEYHEIKNVYSTWVQMAEILDRLHRYPLSSAALTAEDHSNMKELIEPILQNTTVQTSPTLSAFKESVLNSYANSIRDYKAVIIHNINLAAVLEDNAFMVDERKKLPFIYHNIITALLYSNDREFASGQINTAVDKLQKCFQRETDGKDFITHAKVTRMIILDDYTELSELTAIFRAEQIKWSQAIRFNLYRNLVIANYKIGKPEEALSLINEAIDFLRKNKLPGTGVFMIISILIHYEKKDYMYTNNLLTNFWRHNKLSPLAPQASLLTIKHLRRVLLSNGQKDEFIKLKQHLEEDFPDDKNSIFFSYYQWADSIIKGVPYTHTEQHSG